MKVSGKRDRGEVGLDAGQGYYDWQGQDPTRVRQRKEELLMRWTQEIEALLAPE